MFDKQSQRKWWKPRRIQSLRHKLGRQRQARRLLAEKLEERTVLTAGFYETPLFPIAHADDPFGTAQPNMRTAAIHGLHQLLLGRDASDSELGSLLQKLQSGTSLGSISEGMLKSNEYNGKTIEEVYADVLGRAPSAAELGVWQQQLSSGRATPEDLFAQLIDSPENRASNASPEAMVDQVMMTLLDRQPNSTEDYRWTTALRYGAPVDLLVESTTQSEEFAGRVVTGFIDVMLGRNATAEEVRDWVVQTGEKPLEKVLGLIADSPEFYQRANAGTAGKYGGALANLGSTALVSDFGLSVAYATAAPPTALAPTPVASATSTVLLGDTTDGDTSDDSDDAGPLWVSALSFPPVDRDSIQAGGAVQPTLDLPVANFDWSQGFSFGTWFQATAPGVLLSKPLHETTTQQTYQAPLAWIDSNGHLTAGLFDDSELSLVWESTPLNWAGNSDQQIGPANRLTSSMQVLDGNWHHVAYVFDAEANSQTLYLDGLLQGSRTPRSFDSFGDLLPQFLSSSPSVTVELSQTPSGSQVIQGEVYQANLSPDVLVDGQGVQPYSSGNQTQLCTFEIAIENGKVLNTRITNSQSGQSNGAQISGITYVPATSGRKATLQFILGGNRVTPATLISLNANYMTDDARYSILPAAGSSWDPNTSPDDATAPNFQLPGPAGGTWTVGGTTMPQPMSNLYPTENYPQGFQGALDELAIFNRPITQVEVQNAMTQPLWYTLGGAPNETTAVSIGSTVMLADVSDAPTLTASASNPSFTTGGGAAVLYSDSSIGLTGASALKTITLTVGGLQDGADELLDIDGESIALTDGTSATTAAGSYVVSVSVAAGTATVTITKTGGYSVAAAQTLLDGLAYENSSDDPLGANRTVTLTSIQDTGGTAGGRVDTRAVSLGSTVALADVNGAPRLTARAANPSFTAGGAAANLYSGARIGLGDVSGVVDALILTVAGLQNGTDELLSIDGESIALTDGTSATTAAGSYDVSVSVSAGTATVTIGKAGGYSVTEAQTLVNGLAYKNTSNAPLGANRTVTLTSIEDTGGPSDDAMTHYFNFDDSSASIWENQTLYGLGVALARGSLALDTIYNNNMSMPADWADLPRLPGYQAWGLQIMTPFASPSLYVPSGTAVETIVALASGDELTVTLPQTPAGQLQVTVEDSQGNTESTFVFPDIPQTFFAPGNDTYHLTLTWTNAAGLGSVVQFNQVPGSSNSLIALGQSYTTPSIQGATTQYAYADPSLPAINPTAGTASASSAPANYYPTWDDTSYFPASTAYIPDDLATAYAQLVAYSTETYGFTDFCNLLNQGVANPATILNYLKGSYNALFGGLPEAPVDGGPFPVAEADSAPEAVYQFLYNLNLMQLNVYEFIIGGGSSTTGLRGWFDEVLATVAGQSDIPQEIAQIIASGQTQTVTGFDITKPQLRNSDAPETTTFWHKLAKSFWHNSIFILSGALAVYAPETLPLEEAVEEDAKKAGAAAGKEAAEKLELATKERERDEAFTRYLDEPNDDNRDSLKQANELLATTENTVWVSDHEAKRTFARGERTANQFTKKFSTSGAFFNSTFALFKNPLNSWVNYGIESASQALSTQGGAPPSSNTIHITVPLQSITTAELNYENLATMGAGIYATVQEIVASMVTAVSDQRYVQSLMSNYGLLKALQPIESTALSTPELDPRSATQGMLEDASWEHMIPATFHWQAIDPDKLPVADGRTASLTYSTVSVGTTLETSIFTVDTYTGGENEFFNRATADFNNDGFLDLAVATEPFEQSDPATSTTTYSLVSILFGDGTGEIAGGIQKIAKRNDESLVVSQLSVIDLDGSNGPDLVYNLFNPGHRYDNHPVGIAFQLNNGDGTFGDMQELNSNNVSNWSSIGTDANVQDSQVQLIGTAMFNGQPGILVTVVESDQLGSTYPFSTSHPDQDILYEKVPLVLLTYDSGTFYATKQDDSLSSSFPGQLRTPLLSDNPQEYCYLENQNGVNVAPRTCWENKNWTPDDASSISNYFLRDVDNDGKIELITFSQKYTESRHWYRDNGDKSGESYDWTVAIYDLQSNNQFSLKATTTSIANFAPDPSNITFGHFTSSNSLEMAVVLGSDSDHVSYAIVNSSGTQLKVRNYAAPLGEFTDDDRYWYGFMDFSVQGISRPGRQLDDLIVSQQGTGSYLLFNQGGEFSESVFSANDGGQIVNGDFDGDGGLEVIIKDQDNSNTKLALYDGAIAAGINGFVAGVSPATWNANGMSLSDIFDPSSLQAFAQQAVLQGGSPRALMGYDQSQDVYAPTMGTNLLAGLPYQIRLPGAFLTMTPAQLTQESGALKYSSVGAALTAWTLYDGNGNPINLDTAGRLFGVPVSTESVGADGLTRITPSGAQLPTLTPLTLGGGAWYLDAGPVSGAATSFSEAFFEWGLSTPGYAPATTVPYDRSDCYLVNATYSCGDKLVGDVAVDYTLEYAAALDSPPGLRSNQAPQGFSTNGIAGAPYGANAGIDGHGGAYDASLLGTQITYDGAVYLLGEAKKYNAVSAGGQVILVEDIFGDSRYLDLLGAAVNGPQEDQAIVLTFADDTRQVWLQSFSDWTANSQSDQESVAKQMDSYYQWDSSQAQFISTSGTRNVYRYRIALPADKRLISVTLPLNPSVALLAGRITPFGSTQSEPVVSVSGSYNTKVLYATGTGFSSTGGFDQSGNAYDYAAVQEVITQSPYAWALGPEAANHAWRTEGQSLMVPTYVAPATDSYLNLLGATSYGPQTVNFTLNYTDGSSETWTQTFSDWWNAGTQDGIKQRELMMGELIQGSMDHVVESDGTSKNVASNDQVINLYSYSHPLTVGKELLSIDLPNNQHVVLLAANVTSDVSPYNTTGVVSSGTSFWQYSGFDGHGNAYDGAALQDALSSSTLWQIQPGPLNTIASSGQVIDMTLYGDTANYGSGDWLRLLGAAVFGDQIDQQITLRFSDGSTQIWNQSFSDWATHTFNAYSGQVLAGQMDHQIKYDGTQESKDAFVYEYSYRLPNNKQLTAIELPDNKDVRILDIAIDGSNLFESSFDEFGAIQLDSPGNQLGVDGNGNFFASGTLEASQFWNNVNLAYGNPGELDVIQADGQTISMPFGFYSYLNLLGTGVNGAQTEQPFVLNYQDGTWEYWNPSFSDWASTGPTLTDESVLANVKSVGSDGTRDVRLYGYTHLLPTDKRLVSITLPFNSNVILAGVGVSNSAAFSDTAIVEGIGSEGTAFDSGPYLDVEITEPGGNSSEVQRVGFSVPSSTSVFTDGTFTLAYDGQTTSALDWDALTTDVQNALEELPNIGVGNVSVTKWQNSLSAQGWILTFQSALAGQDLSQVSINATSVQMSSASTLTTVQSTDLDGGAATNEVQTVTLYSANGGTFTLTYIDQTTSPIAWNASASAVQNALAALTNIGAGNVLVSGDDGGPWTLAFQGTLANQTLVALTGDIALLNTEAGIDGNGYTYDAALLGSEFTWNDVSISVAPGTETMTNAYGQNIAVSGNGHYLNLLGAGVNGQQADQEIRLIYDDGTQEVWTQTFSDWININEPVAQIYPTNSYDVQVMYESGTTFASTGGFDTFGNAYDYAAVQQALVGSVIDWNLGSSDEPNGWRARGQLLTLPAYVASETTTYLNLLGAAYNGTQVATFELTYSDGTTENWTQSFSDWWNGSGQSGEIINVAMDHRLHYDGSSQLMPSGETLNLFSYKYPLPAEKSLTSIRLPSFSDIVLMGVTVTGTEVAYNAIGVVSEGTRFHETSGFTAGFAFDQDLLENALASENRWQIQPGSLNTIASVGQIIDTTDYAAGEVLRLLGSFVGTPLSVTRSISLNFSDGSTEVWNQSFNNWLPASTPVLNPSERIVATMNELNLSVGSREMLGSPPAVYVYEYSYSLPSGKQLTSIQLPNDSNLRFLGVAIDQTNIASSTALLTTPGPPDQTVALAMDQRIKYDGTIDPTTVHLYGYTHALPLDKRLVSIVLPQNSDLVIAGVGATDSVDSSRSANLLGMAARGTEFQPDVSLDRAGYSYDASAIGDSITWNSATFSLSQQADRNAVAAVGQLLTVPQGQYQYLNLLGTAVNGSQSQQSITLIYDDGTRVVWKQDFSDWTSPQSSVSGESTVLTMNQRIADDGTLDATTVHLYGYQFQLLTDKQLVGIILPDNENVVLLGLALS